MIDQFISVEIRTEQEKDRLANLMAYGTDPTKIPPKATKPSPRSREVDRFDECMRKIFS